MIGYQPSEDVKLKADEREPIPVLYIPRKPHPNEFLFYFAVGLVLNPLYSASTKTTKANLTKRQRKQEYYLPVIVEMVPHLSSQDANPHLVVKQIVDQYIISIV